ncbi:hypothetical protein [Oligosphaera ethanolica]|uniref:Uncharacterized protein n=1 Tax=Oligosphaera ethanolica TaxID=760260 RepID=A0AAE4APM7_9BACT|nr:hypothetical protein [Oligosphaera ethanolica]MDQ0289587.1 hypothetical protein [Oligosphaera ethanolica]
MKSIDLIGPIRPIRPMIRLPVHAGALSVGADLRVRPNRVPSRAVLFADRSDRLSFFADLSDLLSFVADGSD